MKKTKARLCAFVMMLLCFMTVLTGAVSAAEEEEAPFGGIPFTSEGNLTLVDECFQDESTYDNDEWVIREKQFVTVESKSGNTYYIIIDHAGKTDNVYFLNLVDEADLMALMEEGEFEITKDCICKERCEAGDVNTDCPVCRNNLSECEGKEKTKPEPETEAEIQTEKETEKAPEPTKKKSSVLPALTVIVLLAIGGVVYWFKFGKKKPENGIEKDSDDYETEEETIEETEGDDEEE